MKNRCMVIFDGECNFCNGSVNFIISRDPSAKFTFAPMQCGIAERLIRQHKIDNIGGDTFILVKNNRSYVRTDAALEVAKELGGYWHLFNLFKVVPRSIRDGLYRIFARNRYALFGRSSACMIPTPDVRSRFVGL